MNRSVDSSVWRSDRSLLSALHFIFGSHSLLPPKAAEAPSVSVKIKEIQELFPPGTELKGYHPLSSSSISRTILPIRSRNKSAVTLDAWAIARCTSLKDSRGHEKRMPLYIDNITAKDYNIQKIPDCPYKYADLKRYTRETDICLLCRGSMRILYVNQVHGTLGWTSRTSAWEGQ